MAPFDRNEWHGLTEIPKNDRLYFHALTGYTLYSVDAKSLRNANAADEIEKTVIKVAITPAPDGMIFDKKGNLFMADLEKHAIVYLNPKGKLKTLISEDLVGWVDTFSLHNGYLYFTDSKIHMAQYGVEELNFTIFKIKLP